MSTTVYLSWAASLSNTAKLAGTCHSADPFVCALLNTSHTRGSLPFLRPGGVAVSDAARLAASWVSPYMPNAATAAAAAAAPAAAGAVRLALLWCVAVSRTISHVEVTPSALKVHVRAIVIVAATSTVESAATVAVRLALLW